MKIEGGMNLEAGSADMHYVDCINCIMLFRIPHFYDTKKLFRW